jgi:hypothetical protein
MRKSLWALAGALLIWINPAQASLIQVSGQLGWSCGTGSGGFEPGCAPDVERGTFSFAYDTSVIDSDSRIGYGLFLDAFRSFTMTVEQTTRPDLLFTLTGGENAITRGLSGDADWLRITVALAEVSSAVSASSFTFNFLVCCRGVGFPDETPTIENYWSRSPYGLVAYGTGVGETDWLYNATLRAAVIPEPSAPLLLTIGLLALMSTRRRRYK